MQNKKEARIAFWNLTYYCNYRCSYCFQKDNNRSYPRISTIKKILNGLSKLEGVWEIHINGGEVFAVKEFNDFIVPYIAHNTHHNLTATTNLSMPIETYKTFFNKTGRKVKALVSSMHLDYIKNKSQLDKFLAKVKYISEYCKENNILYITMSVAAPDRLDQLIHIKKYLDTKNISIYYQLLKVLDHKGNLLLYNYSINDHLKILSLFNKIDTNEIDAVSNILNRLPNKKEIVMLLYKNKTDLSEKENSILRKVDNSILNKILDKPTVTKGNLSKSYKSKFCRAGIDYFVINPEGRCGRCHEDLEYSLGNIGEGTFKLLTKPQKCNYNICTCGLPTAINLMEN